MLTKLSCLFSMLLIVSCGAAAYGKVIDNFNNDSSLSDQANVTDGSWDTSFTRPAGTVFEINSDITVDGTPNLSFSMNKTPGLEWGYLICGNLLSAGNVHNFTNYTSISADVYGNVKILAKLVDFRNNDVNSKEHETKDIATVSATNLTGWTHVSWDLSNMDWQSCDKTQVNKLFLFFQPGEQGQVSFRIDNIKLEPDSAQYTQKNLLIDNFNGESETNRLGGAGALWPDEAKERVLKKFFFDSTLAQVHGRTGKSLQFWYGDEAGGMLPFNSEFGYYSSLAQKNLSNYGAVSFWVNGPVGGETFQFGLKDINGLEKKASINSYIQYQAGDARNGIVKDKWRKVLIPFSAFSGIDFTNMDNYSITFPAWSKGMIFFDDLLFHTFSWINFQDFEGGSIGSVNGFGGSQGALGKGNLAVETTNILNGSYSGRINSGVDGLVDNFDDGGDPNNWGGANTGGWSNAPDATSGRSYDASVFYGSAGQSLKITFNDSSHPTQNCGLDLALSGGAGHDCSGYDYLFFMVRSTTTGLNFKVGLKDTLGVEGKVDVKNYVSGGLSSTWQQVAIKISDFKADKPALDVTKLTGFTVEFSRVIDAANTSGAVNIDDLEFGRNGAWMVLNNADISKFDSLVFSIKGFAGSEKLNIRLQDSLSGGHDSNEVSVTATTGWVRQKISLSQFTGVTISAVSAIHFAVLTRDATVYIDDIQFGDGSNTALPSPPTGLKANGEFAVNGMVLMPRNMMSAVAAGYTTDRSMEGVRFEYSTDGINWNSMGVDYDVEDTEYALGWNATSLIGQSNCKVHAIAQNIIGNESASSADISNISVQSQDVFVYPNPYYPNKSSKKVHFVNVVTGGILKIYTISGELIITLKDDGYSSDEYEDDGMITWDGKNSDGSLLASGIYVFMLTKDKGKVSSGKFVVIK